MATRDIGCKKRIMLVTNIPNPYRIPLFNQLNSKLQGMDLELKVVFGAKGYERRKWDIDLEDCQFDFEILKSRKLKLGAAERIMFSYKGLLRAINRYEPEIIIIIGYSLGTFKLFLRSFFKKTKYIIWSGSVSKEGRNDTFLRICYRKLLIARAVGFVAYGQKAKDYLISLGAPEDRIQIAINTVDTEFFRVETEKLRSRSVGNNSPRHLTYIGYLEPRKNVMRILEVVKLLNRQRNDFVLAIIGDGSDKKRLTDFADQNGLNNVVSFHGFKQKDELPEFLAKSSCFLFQTDFDIWGLVLNEAMAAGIPCISSINAGATNDLIIEGKTGFALDFAHRQDVLEKINLILDDPQLAETLGTNAQKHIEEHASIEKSASGFVKAIVAVEKGDL